MMTELQLLQRKIELKQQALRLFIEEIRGLNERLALLKMRERAERKIKRNFDPELSRRLDYIDYLIGRERRQ